jgi:N12 class adenine-specific DNA methylase
VQPADLEPGDIEARLGSSWIPPSTSGTSSPACWTRPRAVRVCHAAAIAAWTVEIEAPEKWSVATRRRTARRAFRASELIEQALNGRTPTAYDEHEDGSRTSTSRKRSPRGKNSSSSRIASANGSGKTSDRAAARLARDYNDRFNNLRLRTFDGSHLTFPAWPRALRDRDLARTRKTPSGASCRAAARCWPTSSARARPGPWRPPRWNCAAGSGQKADARGAQSSGRAMGRGVPEALSAGQFFIAGKDHFAAGNRQKAMARIATGNYDAVIVSHRSFEFLPVSDKLFNRFIDQQVRSLKTPSSKPRPKKATTAGSSRNWKKPRSAWSPSSRSAPTASARTTR